MNVLRSARGLCVVPVVRCVRGCLREGFVVRTARESRGGEVKKCARVAYVWSGPMEGSYNVQSEYRNV